jgi:hypothetical protein
MRRSLTVLTAVALLACLGRAFSADPRGAFYVATEDGR